MFNVIGQLDCGRVVDPAEVGSTVYPSTPGTDTSPVVVVGSGL